MRTKTILAATLVLPLLVVACDRPEQSPTAAGPSQERQANAPSSPDRMLESAPPAAGMPQAPGGSSTTPSAAPKAPSSAPSGADSPENQQSEPKKGS